MQNFENLPETGTLRWSKNYGIQYLMQLGLTRIQAILYLNLTLYGEADARLISCWTNLPRTEVYRALGELQEQGLVDREIGSPLKFTAVTPSVGLKAVIERKSDAIVEMQKSLEGFTSEFEGKLEQQTTRDYQIIVIEGRKRIISKVKQQHDTAKFCVDIVSYLPRFLLIANECMDNYKRAVQRGVKYRIIIGLPNPNQGLPVDIIEAHDNENTIMKTVIGNPRANSAIFDREQTSFSYYPDRPIIESPLILTNHPSLVEFAQTSFEQIWSSLQ